MTGNGSRGGHGVEQTRQSESVVDCGISKANRLGCETRARNKEEGNLRRSDTICGDDHDGLCVIT